MGKIVRIEELVEIVGISAITIRRWQHEGLPVESTPKRGVATLFDTQAVIEWIINRRVGERVTPDGKGELLDLDQERARLAANQANKVAIEVDLLRRDVIRVDELAAAWAKIGSVIRGQFLSLANKLAPSVYASESQEEITHLIHNGILDVLGELQDIGVPELPSGINEQESATRH